MHRHTKAAIAFLLVCIAASVLIVLPKESRDGVIAFLALILLLLLGFVLYFMPATVAVLRNHHQVGPIVVVNLLLGWTFLGWVVALAWSLSAIRNPHEAI